MMRRVAILFVHDRFFLKPAWLSLNWGSTTSFILSNKIILNIVPGTDSSVIPR